jgi:hypothetical protein
MQKLDTTNITTHDGGMYLMSTIHYWYTQSMLGGSLVTTAWRVLRLRMEKTPSGYGEELRIY